MAASPHPHGTRHPQLSVRDLVVAPELATLDLLDAALEIAIAALLAEHMTLIDDFRPLDEDGHVIELARTVCRRAGSLRELLARYVGAVRSTAKHPPGDPDADLPF